MKNEKRIVDASTLWFTPAELGGLLVEYGEQAASGGGLDWGIPKLDQTMIPSQRGQLNFILARPGHGKTTVAAYRAKRAADKIIQRGTQGTECVLIVSLDQAVEEVFAMITSDSDFTVSDLAWGRVPKEKLVRRALNAVGVPIRMIGKSSMRKSATVLTFEEIFRAIDDIYKTHHVTPVHIMLDYIQIARLDARNHEHKAEQVAAAVERAEDMAFAYGATIDICAQASRDVDRNQIKLPSIADCQWSSAIEQGGYKIISIWRPALTEPLGSCIDLNGRQEIVTQNLFIMKLAKQKMEAAGYTYILYLDPAQIKMMEMEATR